MNVVAYSRVSTEAQERDGTSQDTQERACLEHARANGWHVAECIRDSASGFSLDRAGIERVRQLLREGVVDVVVAYAVDRLSRNQNHIGVLFDEVEQAGARLEFVTEKFEDTATGRFILAARAFIAEVEREKIVERTMRGKAERARSGRLPQGTGKGCYGYRYDVATGKRHIVPDQAKIVRRIFSDFLAKGSIVSIANRLNDEGTQTFGGGNWHSATIYRMLRNETYTGRTIYRRTIARRSRCPKTGRWRRKVEVRDRADWIEIPDATPAIIDTATFEAVRAVLDDPERRRRGRRLNPYGLSGRLRCARCGKAMVGQTLQKRYRYYRCRRAFSGPRHDRCDAKYVRADDLEAAIRKHVARVLADPGLVMTEYERLAAPGAGNEGKASLHRELDSIDAQKRRLVKLYQLGEIDDDYLQSESRALGARRRSIEKKLQQPASLPPKCTKEQLLGACSRVRSWVSQAEGDNLELLADALQISVVAEKGRAELSGVIPDYAPRSTDADVRPVVRRRLGR